MSVDSLQSSSFGSTDVSDALCFLLSRSSDNAKDVHGHIPSLQAFSPHVHSPNHAPIGNPAIAKRRRVCGPAFTVEFELVNKGTTEVREKKTWPNHIDTCPPGHILVIKSPEKAPNAVWGGLLTARALQVGCQAVIVEGLIRDLDEIEESGLPVFATGTSTLGAFPFCRVASVGEDIILGESTLFPVLVKSGDIIVADRDGVVRVPLHLEQEVLSYCKRRTEMDALCLKDIKEGVTIVETFARHRVGL